MFMLFNKSYLFFYIFNFNAALLMKGYGQRKYSFLETNELMVLFIEILKLKHLSQKKCKYFEILQLLIYIHTPQRV